MNVTEAGGDLGRPRLHVRAIDSTNSRARELAAAGAPHGTLVTAGEQLAGRGRQGRTWSAPPGRALLSSVIVRDPPRFLPLLAGVAVAEIVGRFGASEPSGVQVKWPNDVLLDGRKVAGILVEGRPQDRWAVLGMGLNVALRAEDFPPELRESAATLGLEPSAIEPVLGALLQELALWWRRPAEAVLDAVRQRDALRGHPVCWSAGEGTAEGIDDAGRLVIRRSDGARVALDAGEVHLGTPVVPAGPAGPPAVSAGTPRGASRPGRQNVR